MTEATVCWRAAWLEGLAVALHHRMFVLFALLGVVCERALSFATGSTPEPVVGLGALADLFAAPQARFPTPSASLGPGAALLTLGLFLAGLFIIVGVLGLMRDLLVRRGYRPEDIVARGARYIWPVLKLKLTVYLAFGAPIALLILGACALGGGPWLWLAIAAGLALFALARVVLSLGEKILVVEEPRTLREVCRRVPGLLRPHMDMAARFYAVMFVLMSAAVGAELALATLPLPAVPQIIVMATLLAFATVAIKAASFVFYLQLAGRVPAAVARACDRKDNPEGV
ncbi:MAG: hypothetical protein HLUCCA12_17670 [Rhodobacteraceae bacterium HLUCCA12]|nr:MAG: hypothetical protein HLUCCA12_17670 [Rhodobacteraceae bacterium HLUCCA12]